MLRLGTYSGEMRLATIKGFSTIVALLCFASLLPPLCAATVREAITSAKDILRLTADEAAKEFPVSLRGVVTFLDPNQRLWFLQDSSAGIYFYPSQVDSVIGAGDEIELRGVTGKGLYSPFVYKSILKRVGTGIFPKPKPITLPEVLSGAYDCQWVEVEGVVQKLKKDSSTLLLEIGAGKQKLQAQLFAGGEGIDEKWIDSKVRLTGVAAAAFDAQEHLKGFNIYVSNGTNILRLEPGNNAWESPVYSTRRLFQYCPPELKDHRRHTQGVVLLSWPDETFFIQDLEGILRVQGRGNSEIVPGDRIEVIGFPYEDKNGDCLIEAEVRKKGKEALPRTTAVHAESLRRAKKSGEIVRVAAEIAAVEKSSAGYAVLLARVGTNILRIIAPPKTTLNQFSPPTAVLVTGLLDYERKEIWPSKPQTIEVIANLPLPNSNSSAYWAVAVLFIAGIGGLYFIRRNTAHVQFVQEKASRDRERTILIQNRESLARDLHDGIIQSLYAIGLNIEDCKCVAQEKPEGLDKRLQSVLNDLNGVIGEVRNFIGGLKSEGLRPEEIKPALKSLVLTLGGSNSSKFLLDLEPGAAETLSSPQATHLLYIAREAMSNSLKHSGAKQILISLRRVGQQKVQFEVSDNGRGFNRETLESSGWGLKNIMARVKEMGGQCEIISKPLQGTRIVIDLGTGGIGI